MTRLFRPALLAAALVLAAGPALAEQVPIADGQSIEISPPNGYCVLDESRPVEAGFIKTIRGTVGNSMRLALAFGDCNEVVELRDGKRTVLDNFGQILMVATSDGAVRKIEDTRSDYFAAITKSFPGGKVEDVAANGAAQLAAKGADAPQPIYVVIGQDDRAVYIATTKVQSSEDERSVVAGLAGIALVRHASVTFNLFSAYNGDPQRGAEILTGLAERLKVSIEDTQFLNEDAPAEPTPLPVPSRSEWKAMASTAVIGAAIGGTVGGLGALLVYWLRRRRRVVLEPAAATALPATDSTKGD